jgi:hypothetical protein
MFSKRSGNSPPHDKVMDNTNQIFQHLMARSLKDSRQDPVLAELSTKEILEALDILENVNNSQNDDYINDLSEKEVKKCFF